jgi:hypothetical protein
VKFQRANYSRARVEVREHLNGKMSVLYKGRKLKHRKITRITRKQRQEALKEEALRQADISMLQLHGCLAVSDNTVPRAACQGGA